MTKPILLASTSKYRIELLKRTGLSFASSNPFVDEDKFKQSLYSTWASAKEIADTLAKEKAEALKNKDLLVIAGDQLVHFNNHIYGKPGSFGKAFEQLSHLAGNAHELITSVVIYDGLEITTHTNITKLRMKNLSSSEIKRYLKLDQPFDCAGSYKIESYGITLFKQIETDDFSAIQGLPLIWITNVLQGKGYELFRH